MRYYPGLGVGHKYGWSQKAAPCDNDALSNLRDNLEEGQEIEEYAEEQEASGSHEGLGDEASLNSMDRGSRSSDEELDGEGTEFTAKGTTATNGIESEDEELCAHHEMYDSEG